MAKKLLAKYRAKRDFSKTAEPSGNAKVNLQTGFASSFRSMQHRISITI